jgi:hypothetical protein
VAPSLQFLLDVRMRGERMALQHLDLQRAVKPFVLAIGLRMIGPAVTHMAAKKAGAAPHRGNANQPITKQGKASTKSN